MDLLRNLSDAVERYSSGGGTSRLALLRWQIERGDALGDRRTAPGHITTSAIIISPDFSRTLLIRHKLMGRWQPPGGHFESAEAFWQSAAREALEETGVHVRLHDWHGDGDDPFVLDTQDVPGNLRYGEQDHIHHDLQYLFVADLGALLRPQESEVSGVRWFKLQALEVSNPIALRRIQREILCVRQQ